MSGRVFKHRTIYIHLLEVLIVCLFIAGFETRDKKDGADGLSADMKVLKNKC